MAGTGLAPHVRKSKVSRQASVTEGPTHSGLAGTRSIDRIAVVGEGASKIAGTGGTAKRIEGI